MNVTQVLPFTLTARRQPGTGAPARATMAKPSSAAKSPATGRIPALACLVAAALLTTPAAIAENRQPESALLRSIPGAFSEPTANGNAQTPAGDSPQTVPPATPANGNGLRIAPGSKAAPQPPVSTSAAPATPDPEAIVRALTGAEPLQPPRDITRTGYWQANARWLLPLCVVLVLIVAALGLILYRRSRRPVTLSPQLLALQGIDNATAYSDDKLFAVHVSNAVRAYLEARFHLRAPEQTTEEFLQEARSDTRLPRPAVQTLAHLLELCDLAKFARKGLSTAQRNELAESARQLVQSLGQSQDANSPQSAADTTASLETPVPSSSPPVASAQADAANPPPPSPGR